MSSEEWIPIRGFTGYFINERGQVLDDRHIPSEILHPETMSGRLIVLMVADGAFHVHAVSLEQLMVEYFIDPPERTHLYDLVHIDGNKANCSVENLGWRRKWTPKIKES